MPFLTNDDIKKRKAAGIRMNKLNCGWNLPSNELAKITIFINEWEPQTEVEKRDKHILELAFIQDMNASQIRRLEDPLIIGMGNRSRGKLLSQSSIIAICYKYLPEAKRRKYKGRATREQALRTELFREQQKEKITRPKICCTCGEKKNIELHHIIPLIAGGTNDYYNLIYLCHNCHMKLHHKIYDALQWKNSNCDKIE